MSHFLESIFGNLRGSRYTITSPRTAEYNCIAYAAGKEDRWWWPGQSPYSYWPPDVPREETIGAFIAAFGTLDYSPCADGSLESGFEKVAIYADANGKPTHMARQHLSGLRVSKCGKAEDIEHETLEALEGETYGSVIQFLKRPVQE